MSEALSEVNFDGLAGPSHNFAGLSPGNLASTDHAGQSSNPRQAALQGLEKMRFVHRLGVPQGVLPPQPRPLTSALRRLGFSGTDFHVLTQAAEQDHLLRLCSSASAMWTANAATVAPSTDSRDGRVHFTPANLSAMFHRSLEAETTTRVLRAIFSDEVRFAVHSPLPQGSHFADEGAANHTRLCNGDAALHLFAWGRSAFTPAAAPERYPARQTLEASQSVARLNQVQGLSLFWQQAPTGIDAGAFHTDVLAVGSEHLLLLHEHAFIDTPKLIAHLKNRLGEGLRVHLASEAELPARSAVAAYPFNSQLLKLPSGKFIILAPKESERDEAAARYLSRAQSALPELEAVHYLDLNQSMQNGGGPACLRLRVPLNQAELGALGARALLDEPLIDELEAWVKAHYRDRLTLDDLKDPEFLTEVYTALDELTQLLRLGSVYDFQLSWG